MFISVTIRLLALALVLMEIIAVPEPLCFGRPSGQLNLDELQHRELFGENTIGMEVKRLDDNGHRYRALQAILIDDIKPPQIDCWALFQKYMDLNRPTFQAWANKHCKNFINCWCCPGGGLCVTFIVKPNSPPCLKWKFPAYQAILPVFEADIITPDQG